MPPPQPLLPTYAYLHIVPIHLASGQRRMLDALGKKLGPVLGLTPRVRRLTVDADLAFDPERGQYNSTQLLRQLAGIGHEGRVLGVAGVDLYLPVFTFVIGEAMLDGRAAVVSSFRLRASADESADTVFERLAKEALHELGHTYGLLHCHDTRCAMRSATGVDEVDLKGDTFCTQCRRIVASRRPEHAAAR